MPDIQNEPESESGTENALPTPTEEGYRICIDVTAQGYAVYQDSLPQESNDSEPTTDLTTALKQVIAITKAHPIGSDAQAQFKAGYES